MQPFGDWLAGHLGLDPRAGIEVVDWLTVPQQQLLGVVRGVVHADPNGEIAAVRTQLAWYPDDVWRWLLASQWTRVSQEQAFAGRAAEANDELGSRIVTARLVRELMRLAFLLERTYWPYTKWFGTAFSQLPLAGPLSASLGTAVSAVDYPSREEALVAAYEVLARRHNELGLHALADAVVGPYFSRPYRVVHCEPLVQVCVANIVDPWLRALPLVGSVDQFADSTDVLSAPDRARRLRAIYRG